MFRSTSPSQNAHLACLSTGQTNDLVSGPRYAFGIQSLLRTRLLARGGEGSCVNAACHAFRQFILFLQTHFTQPSSPFSSSPSDTLTRQYVRWFCNQFGCHGWRFDLWYLLPFFECVQRQAVSCNPAAIGPDLRDELAKACEVVARATGKLQGVRRARSCSFL